MLAKVIFALAVCLAAVNIIGAAEVADESDDLIMKIEDEFLEVDNEWEDHSGELLEEVTQSTEVEGCHPDGRGQRIRRCLKEYLPSVLAYRKKIIEQIRAVKGGIRRLRSCKKEHSRDNRIRCELRLKKEIAYDISVLKVDLNRSRELLKEVRRCIRA